MAKYPYIPFYTNDYLADTRHLTTLQHGIYLLLLFTAWHDPDNSLPDDDKILARLAGVDFRTWVKNKGAVLAFWQLDTKQRWRQARLDEERIYAEQLSSKNSVAGKASALKRKERRLTPVQPELNKNSTTSYHTYKKEVLLSKEDNNCDFGENHGCPYQEILEQWNSFAKEAGLPLATKLTDERKRKMKSRWCECGKDINKFIQAMMAISESKFHLGENPSGWKADFDFLLKPGRMIKLIEQQQNREEKPNAANN